MEAHWSPRADNERDQQLGIQGRREKIGKEVIAGKVHPVLSRTECRRCRDREGDSKDKQSGDWWVIAHGGVDSRDLAAVGHSNLGMQGSLMT